MIFRQPTITTGVNADSGLYPLTFAVIEGETESSWRWFISRIYELIANVHQNKRITFISDQMKGIPNALKPGWPSPHNHRYCLRHIRANFQKEFKDKVLHNLLWEVGCATNPDVYKAKRVELIVACEDADTYIENSSKDQEQQWALSRDGGHRLCMMTTNTSESFNDVFKGARALPLQALIVRIFFRLVKFFRTRREEAEQWNMLLTPKLSLIHI